MFCNWLTRIDLVFEHTFSTEPTTIRDLSMQFRKRVLGSNIYQHNSSISHTNHACIGTHRLAN